MGWILIRTFLVMPLVLIFAALILLMLGLQAVSGGNRPSTAMRQATQGPMTQRRSAWRAAAGT